MATSYAQLKNSPVQLEPAEVSISGIAEPLLIHQFTMNQIKKLMEAGNGEDNEIALRKQVLKFLNGFDCQPSDKDCDELGDIFAGWQLREIYSKALKLNGFGADALRNAEKN
jgi:hypothetical protein